MLVYYSLRSYRQSLNVDHIGISRPDVVTLCGSQLPYPFSWLRRMPSTIGGQWEIYSISLEFKVTILGMILISR